MGTLSISPLTPSNLRHRGKLLSPVSVTSKGLNCDCLPNGGIAECRGHTPAHWTGRRGGAAGGLHLPPHPSLGLPTFGSQNLQEGSSILHQEGRFPQRWHCSVSGIYLCPKTHKNLTQISRLMESQSSHGYYGLKPCLPHLWEWAGLNSKH